MRRGIDIDAGCGQLKSKLERNKDKAMRISVVEEDDEEYNNQAASLATDVRRKSADMHERPEFSVQSDAIDLDDDDFEDPELMDDAEKQEAARLIALVQGTTIDSL